MVNEIENTQLLGSIRQLIEESRQQVAATLNATMIMLFWLIGKKISEAIDGQNEIIIFQNAENQAEVPVPFDG